MNLNYLMLIAAVLLFLYAMYGYWVGKIWSGGDFTTPYFKKQHGFLGEVLSYVILAIFFLILFILLQNNIIYIK